MDVIRCLLSSYHYSWSNLRWYIFYLFFYSFSCILLSCLLFLLDVHSSLRQIHFLLFYFTTNILHTIKYDAWSYLFFSFVSFFFLLFHLFSLFHSIISFSISLDSPSSISCIIFLTHFMLIQRWCFFHHVFLFYERLTTTETDKQQEQ